MSNISYSGNGRSSKSLIWEWEKESVSVYFEKSPGMPEGSLPSASEDIWGHILNSE